MDLIAINEKSTGKFSCASLNKPAVESYFQIFVPGTNIFVTPNQFGITRARLFQNSTSTDKNNTPTPENFTMILPCAVSNPNETVSLGRIHRLQDAIYIQQQIIDGEVLRFDPALGFLLKSTSEKNPPWGSYICMDSNKKKLLKVNVDPVKGN